MDIGPGLPLAGLVVGFLIGASGVGSGALMAPFLLAFGVPPATVVGSDLGFSLVTKSAGVGLHAWQGVVRLRWVLLLAVGSVPGTVVGSLLLGRIARSPDTVRLWIAAVLVVASATALLVDATRRRRSGMLDEPRRPAAPPWVIPLVGALIGLAVGATSVGSGSLVDLSLILLSPLSAAEIVGTGLAHAILLSSVAAVVHWNLGTIDPTLVLNLLVGSIPGVLLGGRLAYRAPTPWLRRGIAGLVLMTGLATLAGSLP